MTATTPANGATGVGREIAITATFSEHMDAESVTSGLTVLDVVTGNVHYQDKMVTFGPAEPLTFGTTYTATLSTTVRDLAGNRLAAPYSWTFTMRTPAPASFTTLSLSSSHACGVTAAGLAYCWGRSDDGALGEGIGGAYDLTPVAVAGGLTFTTVAAGGSHTCGLTTGGAYCWGRNNSGQVGDGTTTLNGRRSPVRVAGGLTFASLTLGLGHTCGLTAAGAAYCWGDNFEGQLGDGTTVDRSVPVPVAGGLSFAALAAHGHHTCGITAAGVPYCWGDNNNGQLGDGTTDDRSSAVEVIGGHRFAAIAAGFTQTCGITGEGTAYCWGSNEHGQLGDGTTIGRSSPVAVGGGLRFAAISSGAQHTCGVDVGGAGYCWGNNASVPLGIGTMSYPQSTPALVVGGLNFATISAGLSSTCGLTVDRAAYCWGSNVDGRLGDGTRTNRHTPTRVVQ